MSASFGDIKHPYWFLAILGSLALIGATVFAIESTLAMPLAVVLGLLVLTVLLVQSSELLVMSVIVWGMSKGIPYFALFNEDAQVNIIPGRSLSTIGLTLTVLFMLVLTRVSSLLLQRRSMFRRNLAPIFLLAFAALSLAWGGADSFADGVRWVSYLAVMAGVFYLIIADISRSQQRVERLIYVLLVTLILFAAGSLIFGGSLGVSENVLYQDIRGERLKGIANSPNILAGIINMFMALNLGIVFADGTDKRMRNLAWIGLMLGVLNLLFSLSQSGMIGFALALALMLRMKRQSKWIPVLVIPLLVAFMFTTTGQQLLSGIMVIWRDPLNDTLPGWQTAALRMILWNQGITDLAGGPSVIFGSGAGSVASWCPSNPNCLYGGGLHSDILQIWLDLGVVGVALVLGMFISLSRKAWSVQSDMHLPLARALGLAALAALAAAAPRLIWDFLLNAQVGWYLMIVCGLAVGARNWAVTLSPVASRNSMAQKYKFPNQPIQRDPRIVASRRG